MFIQWLITRAIKQRKARSTEHKGGWELLRRGSRRIWSRKIIKVQKRCNWRNSSFSQLVSYIIRKINLLDSWLSSCMESMSDFWVYPVPYPSDSVSNVSLLFQFSQRRNGETWCETIIFPVPERAANEVTILSKF